MAKSCKVCGESFTRPKRISHKQWNARLFCSRRCGNTWKAQQQTRGPRYLREQQARWGRAWERERRREEREELRRKPKVGPHCRLRKKPTARLFICRVCRGCGSMWVSYAARDDTDYCSLCNERRWRRSCNHKRRVRLQTARREVVSHDEIFRRDGLQCQECGVATMGKWPSPNAPTLDHIFPLSKGGDHSYANVRLLCNECNTRKGDKLSYVTLRGDVKVTSFFC